MGIFDLPPKKNWVIDNRFFCKGNIIQSSRLKDPDYFIVYRVGVVMRYWAILLGGIAFIISYFHSFYGVFPEISSLYDEPVFLDVFNGLISWVGRLMLVILAYYFVLFFKNVSFKDYNILRYGHVTSKGFGFDIWLSFILGPLIILFCLTFLGSSFDFFLMYGSLLSFVNSVFFVFMVYLISVLCLGLMAQVFFLVTLYWGYIIFERINNNV